MRSRRSHRNSKQGFALIVLLAILAVGVLYFVVGQLDVAAVQRERDEATTQALAKAKEALIAYAVSRDLSSGSARPGELPCPDISNSGSKGASCGNQAGTTGQGARLGRLPWRELGLPDVRDDAGERLWYAVSNNFKERFSIYRLNSDTMRIQSSGPFVPTAGSITVRDNQGNLLFGGSGTSGVVAVIIAPGAPITRQDGLQQDRSAANVNSAPHYLDNISPAPDNQVATSEDNASFLDNAVDGFFAGPVRNNGNVTIANDRVLVVTLADITAAMESRVAGEVSHCLEDYAAQSQNKGHLPWAASIINSANGTNFNDVSGVRFGRLPDDLTNAVTDSNPATPGICPPSPPGPPLPTLPMLSNWTGTCMVNSSNPWFIDDWRDIVFFGVADSYKPTKCPVVPCGTCLTVNRTGGPLTNRHFVVVVAGRALTGQARSTISDKGNVANYLELQNSTPNDDIFQSGDAAAGFNDRVRYFPSQ